VIEQMLADARSRIARYTPAQAAEAEVVIVDVRSHDERERDGIIPGSLHVPRSVLEWRCDPGSGWANPYLAGKALALVCAQGYSSSLAAASLRELGLEAGDLVGGFGAWCDAGLPVAPAPAREDGLPGLGGPQ
jgi:rhodanese-related sulfurtransferase